MRYKDLLGVVALAATVGVGCSADGMRGEGAQAGKADMAFVFGVDDGGLPPDLGEPACQDTDPWCREFALGPDYNKPFPLPTDPQPDPNAAASSIVRDPNGWLGLDVTQGDYYFAWVAQDSDGTVAKVDTRTMREVARYRTVTCFSRPTGSNTPCDGKNGCCAADSQPEWENRKAKRPDGPAQQVQLTSNSPSRTAVDFNGDLFIANRAFGGQASVTKIANVPGRCKDRNKNGRIDTSSDVNHDGRIDRNDPKEFLDLDDECVLWTANHGAMNATGRPLALGPGSLPNVSDAFAGEYSTGMFLRIDGTTGKTKDEWQLPQGCQPYGLAIDAQGFGWAGPFFSGPLCYFDIHKNINVGKAPGTPSGYGITLDRDQNIWVGSSVARYTPDRSKGFDSLGNGYWTKISGLSGIGIAADSRNDKKYFVWSAGGSVITRIPASEIPLPKGADVTVQLDPNWPKINASNYGVGLDVDQNVVAVPHTNVVIRTKVDKNGDFQQPDVTSMPKNGTLCPAGDQCDLGSHQYTYSDFTGFGLRNFTSPTGTYSYVVKGCVDEGRNTRWFDVTWDALVPARTKLTVHARSGPAPSGPFGAWTPEVHIPPADLSPPGVLVPNAPDQDNAHYLQVEFIFQTDDRIATPKLKSFHVTYRCGSNPT